MLTALRIQVAVQLHYYLPCLCTPESACQCQYGSFERQPPSQVLALLAACGDRARACTWAAQSCEEAWEQEHSRPPRGRYHQKGHLHHHGPDWGPVRQPRHSGGDPLQAGEGQDTQRPPGTHTPSCYPGLAVLLLILQELTLLRVPLSCHTMCHPCKGSSSWSCKSCSRAQSFTDADWAVAAAGPAHGPHLFWLPPQHGSR